MRTHHWLSTTWMREVTCPRNSLCTLVSRLELNAQTQREQLELRSHADHRDSLRRGAPREPARTPSKTSTSTSENLNGPKRPKPSQSGRTHPAGASAVDRSMLTRGPVAKFRHADQPRHRDRSAGLSQPGRTRDWHSGTARDSRNTRPRQHGDHAWNALHQPATASVHEFSRKDSVRSDPPPYG